MTAPLVSVIMPAHNEQAALPRVVRQVLEALREWPTEILVVDDGSTDATWSVIQELAAEHPEVTGLRFTRNFGHQSAILAGLGAARGDAVVMMDADGQHPPELLSAFVTRWRDGAAVVQGIRDVNPDAGAWKRWTSDLFYGVITRLAGVRIPRGSADFRLLDREVVDRVLGSAGPLLFLRGLIPWLGYDTATVRFEAQRRLAGRSSYTLSRMVGLSLDGVLSFSIVPLRLATAVGASVSALSFLYLIYIVAVRLGAGRAVPGWASTAGLLALLGGLQLLTMGVLGEYIGRIFLASQSRPHFVVREQVGGAHTTERTIPTGESLAGRS
jgi:polyisoprenyl-phosphate glycosyltransferase